MANKARQKPHAYRDEVKGSLDKMLKDRIIDTLKDGRLPLRVNQLHTDKSFSKSY